MTDDRMRRIGEAASRLGGQLRRAEADPPADLAADEGQTWTMEQLREDFEIGGYQAPYLAVRRIADGQLGTVEFTDQPRVYFRFTPAELAETET